MVKFKQVDFQVFFLPKNMGCLDVISRALSWQMVGLRSPTESQQSSYFKKGKAGITSLTPDLVQWVKDPVWAEGWWRLELRLGFNPWPGNLPMLQPLPPPPTALQKKKKKEKEMVGGLDPRLWLSSRRKRTLLKPVRHRAGYLWFGRGS